MSPKAKRTRIELENKFPATVINIRPKFNFSIARVLPGTGGQLRTFVFKGKSVHFGSDYDAEQLRLYACARTDYEYKI